MTFQNPLLAHFYRQKYGDVGYQPIPFIPEEGEVEGQLKMALLDRFSNPRPKMKPPHTADLLDPEGKVIMRLYVVD